MQLGTIISDSTIQHCCFQAICSFASQHANSKCVVFLSFPEGNEGKFFVQRCRRRGEKVDSFNSYYDFGGGEGGVVKERIAVNKGLESSR